MTTFDMRNELSSLLRSTLYISDESLSIATDYLLRHGVTVKPKIDIRVLLDQMGIPQKYVGYQYLIEVLDVTTRDPRSVNGFFNTIVSEIAERNNVSPHTVYDGIKNAIRSAFINPTETLLNIFSYRGYIMRPKITPKYFISKVTMYITMNYTCRK